MKLATVAALLLVAAVLPGVARASGPISLPAYTRGVDKVARELRVVGPLTTPRSARVRGQLLSLARVRLPDGGVLRTDMPRLAAALRSANLPAMRIVSHRLKALDAELHAQVYRSAAPGQLRGLDVILAQPAFRPTCNITQCVTNWIGSLIQQLFNTATSSPDLAGIVALMIAGAFVLLVILGLGWLIRAAVRRIGRNISPPPNATSKDGSREATQEAERHVAGGDYRGAVRFLFRATMLTLHERGYLDLRPGLTNREYLAQMERARKQVPRAESTALRELVDEFDRVWYGHVPFGAAEYARFEELVSRVLTLPAARRAA